MVRGGRRGALYAKSLECYASLKDSLVFGSKFDLLAHISKQSPEFVKKFLNICRSFYHFFLPLYLREGNESCFWIFPELIVVAGYAGQEF